MDFVFGEYGFMSRIRETQLRLGRPVFCWALVIFWVSDFGGLRWDAPAVTWLDLREIKKADRSWVV